MGVSSEGKYVTCRCVLVDKVGQIMWLAGSSVTVLLQTQRRVTGTEVQYCWPEEEEEEREARNDPVR